MPDPATTPEPLSKDKPARRWTDSRRAAVVEAAYILDSLRR